MVGVGVGVAAGVDGLLDGRVVWLRRGWRHFFGGRDDGGQDFVDYLGGMSLVILHISL